MKKRVNEILTLKPFQDIAKIMAEMGQKTALYKVKVVEDSLYRLAAIIADKNQKLENYTLGDNSDSNFDTVRKMANILTLYGYNPINLDAIDDEVLNLLIKENARFKRAKKYPGFHDVFEMQAQYISYMIDNDKKPTFDELTKYMNDGKRE